MQENYALRLNAALKLFISVVKKIMGMKNKKLNIMDSPDKRNFAGFLKGNERLKVIRFVFLGH